MKAKKILLLATYGMEIVECGGVLAKHAENGNGAEAAVALSRPESREQVKDASAVLGVNVRFLDFTSGDLNSDKPSKEKTVSVIRETKPGIVITQDPEHSYLDLDPDRRAAMILYIEAVSLAARDWQIEECGGFPPHSIDSLYFMTPDKPNCVINIADYFSLKEEAMSRLTSQLAFSAKVLGEKVAPEAMKVLLRDYEDVKDDPAKLGSALHREMDRAYHLYHGLLCHTGFAVAEPYRKADRFELEYLF